jgi:hypothetical protein
MLEASCHCGSVRIEVPRKPQAITDCNCSICRRYGVLWAYYPAAEVVVRAGRNARSSYSWGTKGIRFVRCRRCGCVTHWEEVKKMARPRIGVNARNFDPKILTNLRVRHLDGADTWKYLD